MNEVRYYTTARLVQQIHFIEDRTTCYYCRFCVKDHRNHQRIICAITDEPLVHIDQTRGYECPLIFDTEGGSQCADSGH